MKWLTAITAITGALLSLVTAFTMILKALPDQKATADVTMATREDLLTRVITLEVKLAQLERKGDVQPVNADEVREMVAASEPTDPAAKAALEHVRTVAGRRPFRRAIENP